ncbi:MAG: cell division protein ZipA [Chromatiaceae bacterium]|nr:cell division protein ZipA [Chromatiaceae bacterium]MCP5314326.1 cell division protein ZipA [Chromatiaceae bacterium]
MDPDLVRLILVVLGVLLVAGIYLWDRYKRALPHRRRVRRRVVDHSMDSVSLDDAAEGNSDPGMYDGSERVPEMRIEDDDRDRPSVVGRAVRRSASALDPEPAEIGEWTAAAGDGDRQFSMDLQFDAHGDADYLSTDPALRDEVERKLVIINLVAKSGDFAGPDIERACADNRLGLGDMSIYHRREGGGGRVIFSIASMVEPGTFPVDGMDDFQTPGLTMFTQLPGVRDGVEIYDEMLVTANRLAVALQGELQDERHNKLTRQMEKHTRESIIEHRHRVKLARSRH